MGQAIVYCSNCSAQVRGSDFETRKAFRVDDQIFCAKCCREILGQEPEMVSPVPSSMKLKAHGPGASSTNRIPVVSTPHVHVAPAPEGGSSIGWILGGLGVVVLIIIVVAMSGGESRRDRPTPPSPPPPIAAPTPAPASKPSAREASAQEALGKAFRFASDRPQDLDGQRAQFADALARAEGTPLHEDARKELDRVERRLREREAAKVDVKLFAPPPPPPPPVLVEPKPAAVPAPPPREDPARVARWAAALAPAAGRDYSAAAAALEKLGDAAADVQLLKAVATLHQESIQALLRTPKGQKVALDVRDPAGKPRRIEAPFVGEVEGRLELRGDPSPIEVEVGEILPSSLLKSRGGAADPAAAAVYCLLEGDEEGARRLVGDKAGAVPDRYWTYAGSLPADPARGLYQEALALATVFTTEADAVPKLQALLRDYPESPFVRRNKASIAARAQRCARDFLFVATDLKPSGTFKAARTPKGGGCWTSENDADAAKAQENFLELSYSAVADTTYRCWIYAGGCCRETFEFWVQGTEMLKGKDKEAVEPGSGVAAEVKPYLPNLKKSHSMHNGPKQPSSWEWIPIPLPKYAKAGPQRLRVISDQKGFSVAYACVTATRAGPPKELDLKELEKTRGGAVATAPPVSKVNVLYAAALDGTDRRVEGEVRDKALYGKTVFNSCFAGVGGNPLFTLPASPGELRFTYALTTVTPLTARFRVTRGDKTVPYDVAVPPVAGRPVEVRIPFSDFKLGNGNPGPALVPGDTVPDIYIVGVDVNCGLRINALSIVEIRAESGGTVTASKVAFSENFDAGAGLFQEGTVVDGGVKGKAYAMSKGISIWNAWSFPVKDTTTISFKVKPADHHTEIMILVWSDALKDNGRYRIRGLREGVWNEVRVKATDIRMGPSGDGQTVDVLNNLKLYLLTTDATALVDDFEIRQ